MNKNRTIDLMTGIGIGVGLAALFGGNGRRNRALIRDKAIHYGHESERYFTKKARHLTNRAKGVAHHLGVPVSSKTRDALPSGNFATVPALFGVAIVGVILYSALRPIDAGSSSSIPDPYPTEDDTLTEGLTENTSTREETASPEVAPGEVISASPPAAPQVAESGLQTEPTGLTASRNTGAGTSEQNVAG